MLFPPLNLGTSVILEWFQVHSNREIKKAPQSPAPIHDDFLIMYVVGAHLLQRMSQHYHSSIA